MSNFRQKRALFDNPERYNLYTREFCPEPVIPEREEHVKKVIKPPIGTGRVVMDTLVMTRAFKSEIITVGTTPTLIIKPPHYWPYLISNPALSVGLTNTVTLFNGTVSAAGNTQLSPVGVANYREAHLHFNVTAVTGSWDIYAQTRDPVSGNWADSQFLLTISATGTYYVSTGTIGIVTDFAIRWTPTAAGSMTFSAALTLKDGLVGGPTGLAKTVFIGGDDVTTDTGYPIFEGKDRIIYPGADVEVYAVSYVSTTIKVFRL